ncbi:hypothetical protein ACHQM5_023507 [Ranunculus cassubicifolius]
MPPRAVRRPSTATPLKKRPHTPVEETFEEEETASMEETTNSNNEELHEPEQEQEHNSPTKGEEKEEEEVPVAEQENDRSERLELEDNYYQYEQTDDGAANVEMEEYRDDEEVVEYDEERVDGDEMMDREEEQEGIGGHEEDVNGDEEQDHHDVMKERRKRKEFEVFIGGLDRDATDEDLREVFGVVGEVTEIRLMRNPLTQKNKGFAFIRFATVEQARRAVNELKHPTVNGKQCGVSPSQDSDTLFVGNISKTWTKAVFKEKLVNYGVDNFEELTLVEDVKNEGLNRGFAFLDFSCRADALDACKRLQRMDVVFGTDRTAKVAFADTFIEPDDEIMAQVKTVFLDGLPASWDEERVSEHVNKFGKVEKVELARNMPAAKRTDFGFVTFDTHDAAVGCVDGVNNSEIGDGDKKVKVRARLSRPRQRGKSSRHARGGFAVGRSFGRGGRTSWGSGGSYGDSRYGSRYERDIPSRRTYSGSYRPSYGSRDRYSDVSSTRDVSRRRAPSSERSYSRRSPGVAYGRSSSKREYIRSDEHYPPRSSGFATGARSSGFVSKTRSSEYISKAPTERRGSYRDAYPSRESEYLDSPPRTAARPASRRTAPAYAEDNYVRQGERSSSYRGGHSQDYVSLHGSKRPHSSIEEYPSRFPESTLRQTRARFDYGVGNDDVQYSEYSSAYGSEPTTSRQGRGSHIGYDRGTRSSAAHSHGMYDTHTSSTSYNRDEVRRGGDIGGTAYSSYDRDYPSRDYASTDTEVAATSYSTLYSSRRMTDAYPSGRGSGSYY